MDAHVRVIMSKRLKAAAIAAAFLLSGFLCSCSDCDNSTPVERNGRLHVEGTSLINEHGDVVQLRLGGCFDSVPPFCNVVTDLVKNGVEGEFAG